MQTYADVVQFFRRVSYQSELQGELVISSSLLFGFFVDVGRVRDPKSK